MKKLLSTFIPRTAPPSLRHCRHFTSSAKCIKTRFPRQKHMRFWEVFKCKMALYKCIFNLNDLLLNDFTRHLTWPRDENRNRNHICLYDMFPCLFMRTLSLPLQVFVSGVTSEGGYAHYFGNSCHQQYSWTHAYHIPWSWEGFCLFYSPFLATWTVAPAAMRSGLRSDTGLAVMMLPAIDFKWNRNNISVYKQWQTDHSIFWVVFQNHCSWNYWKLLCWFRCYSSFYDHALCLIPSGHE